MGHVGLIVDDYDGGVWSFEDGRISRGGFSMILDDLPEIFKAESMRKIQESKKIIVSQ